jgi:hypothetical protein
MANKRLALPGLDFLEVHEETDPIPAWIAGGKWIVTCTCGNAPSVSPEWNIARCLECGAYYQNIVWPEDMAMIESLLLVRPAIQRTWRVGETTDQLIEENTEAGL